MKKTILFLTSTLIASSALADPATLKVKVDGVEHGKPIPEKFAFCVPDGAGKTKDGSNINPAISWTGAPKETKSFALLVVDKDVPKTFELANQEGKTIPQDFPRRDFYHWALIDIPADRFMIIEGENSNAETNKVMQKMGKGNYGSNGANDYVEVFQKSHGGYDGPCPPWNDERLHHYHFKVFALDVAELGLRGDFNGPQVMEFMKTHILAEGELVGTYTTNPALLAKK